MSEVVFEKGFRTTSELLEDLKLIHRFTDEQLAEQLNELLESDNIRIESKVVLCEGCNRPFTGYVGYNIEIKGAMTCPYCEVENTLM